jgi:tRNA isopentenyl-2-thiomethyl-A-37 hydroxylase MiaE
VFELASATDASWAPRVVNDLPDLLVDHAHCEKKAAGMAINLMPSSWSPCRVSRVRSWPISRRYCA